MKTREIISIAVCTILLIGGVALTLWKSPGSLRAPHSATVASTMAQIPRPVLSPPSTPISIFTPASEYRQLSLKLMSRDAATRIYVDRASKDANYDWKVALNFYGQVVDQDNHPVPTASVHFDWTTIGMPGNASQADILSDENGLFSLTKQHGKNLGVRVEKDGYYTFEGGKGDLSFEFANPSNPEWYEPEPDNPVIFHLRKKGEGAALFSKNFEVPLNQKHPQDRVNLMQGFIEPDGILTISSDTSKYMNGGDAFPWTITLVMAEGGLVATDDRFPFLAPISGYTSTVTMAMTNTDRSVWRGQMTRTFYFHLPSTQTYGRITVNASSCLPLELNYVYNPIPGNRELEPAVKGP